MKTSLKDFTFLIPIRIDSIARIENLLMSIRYLLLNFETNIMVLEATDYNNGILRKLLDKRVEYAFVEDRDPVFYRTKYLNMMTRKSSTPYIGIWDTDVIIHKKQIIDSIDRLREGYDVAYPFDGHFYDTTESIRELYFRNKNISVLQRNAAKMGLIYGNKSKGGAMFVNKEAYRLAGMENEQFYGWGNEDWERYLRWKTLNYKIHCSKGCLFHLSHSRGQNSSQRSVEHAENSDRVLLLAKWSDKKEILKTIE